MALTIFWIIISIIIFNFCFEKVLSYLNFQYSKKPFKSTVADIYDKEKYNKWRNYENANYKFSSLSSVISFIGILLMFLFEGFALVDSIAEQISAHPILNALIFFAILSVASDILSLPFSLYHTFVIEQKFGFNKTTVKTFFLDKLKSIILSFILGGGIFSIIIYLYNLNQVNFWIYAWIVVSLFSIFMAEFYSVIIVPLFNKQTPLEEGELRTEIEKFSEKVGFKLQNIFIIDGSKRSSKSNAYFTGLGKKKRIVLYDTLVKDLSTQEIVAVLAHEIGHFKKKHIQKSLIISLINTAVIFYIFSIIVGNPDLSKALGVNSPKFHIGLIVFGILYSPISDILDIFMNIFSRKNEREADTFAGENYEKESLIAGLKKLASKNLSNLNPHPFYVFMNYSHPPIAERIELLNKIKK
jgi:STE24 endopeptidase